MLSTSIVLSALPRMTKSIRKKSEPSLSPMMHSIIKTRFPRHPFETGVSKKNSESVMRQYLAMSQAFPYLQAAAHGPAIFYSLKENRGIPSHVEKTAVVASFLCWDEFGGNHLLLNKGMKALPKILDTSDQFHANMLKNDIETLFDKPLQPDYSKVTCKYLHRLYSVLSSRDPVERCSAMVGFEMHAHEMIEALWASLTKEFKVDKDRLEYFKVHVGGDDPAEVYHVKMSQRLAKDLVPKTKQAKFLKALVRNYGLNVDWCDAITKDNASRKAKK